jgi:hypothetical protein
VKRAVLTVGLFACASAACERQDFTGPLVIVDAGTDAAEAAVDAAPDTPDAQEAAVDAPPDAPPPLPTSCKDALALDPAAKSGLFTVDTDGPGARAPFVVHCDMSTDGGGWTLIARSVAGASGAFGWGSGAGDPPAAQVA